MKRIFALLLLVSFSACGPKVGYKNLNDDTVGYNEAVNDSNDKQLLLNIVRLRYRDTPTFLNIGVISAAYDFKRSASVGVETRTNNASSVVVKPNIGMEYSEKPTTTYNPISGKTYVEQALAPIKMDTLILLNATGWKTERILRTCVQRLNNIRNAPTASGPTPSTEPEYEEFIEIAKIFNELDVLDALHIQKRADEKGNPAYYLTLDQYKLQNFPLDRFWSLLGLRYGLYEFHMSRYSGKEPTDTEILFDTRSPLGILYFLSHGVDVPVIDEMEGRVTVTRDDQGGIFDWDEVLGDLFEVHSIDTACAEKCNFGRYASTWVKYRGQVFYISDTDLDSKSTFSLLAQIMALQSGCPDLPVLTLPISQR